MEFSDKSISRESNERIVEELRHRLDGLLAETGLYKRIRQVIQETTAGEDVNGKLTRATLARLVSQVEQPVEQGVEEKYREGELPMAAFGGSQLSSGGETKLALKIEVLGAVGLAGEAAEAFTKGVAMGIKAHLGFNGQRGETDVVRAGPEPAVRGSYLFEIESPLPTNEAVWTTILSRPSSMVRFCLTREKYKTVTDRRELCATAILDWRQALLRPGETVEVPLTTIGPDAVLEAGLGDSSAALHLILDVIALGSEDEDTLETPFDDEAVRRAITRSRSAKAQVSRRFFLYAKQWWDDYTRRLHHAQHPEDDAIHTQKNNAPPRSVQLFARDETGELRCASTFVWPLRATGRGLDSPRHCARFVSLLSLEKDPAIHLGGSGTTQPWQTPLAFLARRAGDVWDHAVLLCSLLLGFGLEAYVALGEMRHETQTQPHAWVLTFSTDQDSGSQRAAAWESTTGRRSSMLPLDPETARKYDTITALFNHDTYLVNAQASHHLADGISLDLDDDRHWKAIDPNELSMLIATDHTMPYIPAIADIALLPPRQPSATEIEYLLKSLIQRRRLEDHGLLTAWDSELSYMLAPALNAYEHAKLTGQAIGNDDFADAIKRHVPKGHCFKGFPTCFPHLQADRMITALLRGELSADVIATAGDHVRHAIRVRIFPYAENVCACWVMIAVRYLNPGQPLLADVDETNSQQAAVVPPQR